MSYKKAEKFFKQNMEAVRQDQKKNAALAEYVHSMSESFEPRQELLLSISNDLQTKFILLRRIFLDTNNGTLKTCTLTDLDGNSIEDIDWNYYSNLINAIRAINTILCTVDSIYEKALKDEEDKARKEKEAKSKEEQEKSSLIVKPTKKDLELVK